MGYMGGAAADRTDAARAAPRGRAAARSSGQAGRRRTRRGRERCQSQTASRILEREAGKEKAPVRPALCWSENGPFGRYCTVPKLVWLGICELPAPHGVSPWCGSSTTTMVPIFTRLYRSITSSLVIRMQPDEIEEPIYSGWLVP